MFKQIQKTMISKLAIAGMLLAAFPAIATENTLVSFNWLPAPNAPQTGAYPGGTLLRDANGNLYGANWLGGEYDNGTVFKLSPPGPGETEWKLSILYTFTGWDDGGLPNPQLVMDADGALYGTTEGGGSWLDQGLVFKLTPPVTGNGKWNLTVLHYFYSSFLDGPGDGTNPSGGLIMDKNGNLYGTTDLGGDPSDPEGVGSGAVFKLTPLDAARTKWQESILYRFKGGADGANPMAALTLDSAGNLYGTTLYGGTGGCVDLLFNTARLRYCVSVAASGSWTDRMDQGHAASLRGTERRRNAPGARVRRRRGVGVRDHVPGRIGRMYGHVGIRDRMRHGIQTGASRKRSEELDGDDPLHVHGSGRGLSARWPNR